jgi:plasmid maintenance system antidote protein VapI
MNPEDMPEDVRALFQHLAANGIQQTWLARQLGISPAFLTNIKMGRKPMPTNVKVKVCEVLDEDPQALFPGQNVPVRIRMPRQTQEVDLSATGLITTSRK